MEFDVERMSVIAPLQYIASRESVAEFVASQAGGVAATHPGEYNFVDVEIANGRGHNFHIDREGFQLVAQPSAVSDFYDDLLVNDIYEAEVKDLVRTVTGADQVHIFDHTRRAASDNLRKAVKSREPASVIHNDYTDFSAPQRLRDLLPDQAEARLQKRFAIVNVWRSIVGSVETFPMAFCDSTSVAIDDLVPIKRLSSDRIGEIQYALHNPKHCWFYFPAMTMNEVALIKTYDSATDGRARFTIHSAFDDPSAAADAAPRQSIETRCFVFF
ncbi:MAG: methyltransferase [Candidatus Puniceispirillum sp.]|nr:methyltransferase [Candidatus Puniceispirillum sp.]